MMRNHLNTMLQVGDVARAALAVNRPGIVRNYDPASYSVKVELPDDGTLTNWVPLKALAVGDGFGILAAPNIGDMVDVHFLGGSIECATVGLRFFGDGAAPPAIAAGEFLIRHQSGSSLHFRDDGQVDLITAGALNVAVEGDAVIAVDGTISSEATQWNHAGPVKITGPLEVDGDVTATGDITDLSGANTNTIGNLRTTYNTHTHPENGDGGGTTSVPNQQI